MDEHEWLASDDPARMLAFLTGPVSERDYPALRRFPRPSERRLYLFASEAGCEHCAILAQGRRAAFWADSVSKCESCAQPAVKAALLRDLVSNPWRPAQTCKRNLPCDRLCRCLLSEWLTPTVLAIARRAYDERDFAALPILADALEEAGCESEDILRHLRGQERCWLCERTGGTLNDLCSICGEEIGLSRATGWMPLRGPHARGCWALDLVLNKE